MPDPTKQGLVQSNRCTTMGFVLIRGEKGKERERVVVNGRRFKLIDIRMGWGLFSKENMKQYSYARFAFQKKMSMGLLGA